MSWTTPLQLQWLSVWNSTLSVRVISVAPSPQSVSVFWLYCSALVFPAFSLSLICEMVGSALLCMASLLVCVCEGVHVFIFRVIHKRVLSHNFLNEDLVNMSCSLFLVEAFFVWVGARSWYTSFVYYLCKWWSLWTTVWAQFTISFWQNTTKGSVDSVDSNRIYLLDIKCPNGIGMQWGVRP